MKLWPLLFLCIACALPNAARSQSDTTTLEVLITGPMIHGSYTVYDGSGYPPYTQNINFNIDYHNIITFRNGIGPDGFSYEIDTAGHLSLIRTVRIYHDTPTSSGEQYSIIFNDLPYTIKNNQIFVQPGMRPASHAWWGNTSIRHTRGVESGSGSGTTYTDDSLSITPAPLSSVQEAIAPLSDLRWSAGRSIIFPPLQDQTLLTVFNLGGRCIFSQNLTKGSTMFELRDIPTGYHIVRLGREQLKIVIIH